MLSALRRSTFLARLVLAWLVVSLGVAVASPLVQLRAIEWVCTGTAIKAVVITDDGAVDVGARHLDCPLCLPWSAPPPVSAGVPTPWLLVSRLDARLTPVTVPWTVSRLRHARGPPLIA